MHSRCIQIFSIALAALCVGFVLTLAVPKAAIADHRVQTAETSQVVSGVCPEQRRLTFVSQPLGAYLAIVDQQVSKPDAAYGPQPEETVRAELQVPTALLRTLGMEEGISSTIELHVPAALLVTLSAEGGVLMPQRSPDLCGPFFSLY